MYISPEEKDALYDSLYRIARRYVPGCTLEQVKKSAGRFYDHKNTRLQSAFVLYWQLSEGRIADSEAETFLEHLHKQQPAIKEYWLKTSS